MKYFLGQLVWRDEEWHAPQAGDKFIDLRPVSVQSIAETTSGHVLICTERDPVGDELLVADGEVLDSKALDGVKDLLGIPETITATSTSDLVTRLLGVYSDPDVGLLCPPLMPDHHGMLRLRVGGITSTSKCPTSGSVWENILKVLQSDYRNVRQQSGSAQMHRKLLRVWQRKFGIANHEVFIPQDLPKETPVKPATIITDNFNVGDYADLHGNPSQQGWNWDKIEGSGNALYRTNTQVYAEAFAVSNQRGNYRAQSDLSSTDHFVQGIMASFNNDMFVGLLGRKENNATLTYYDVQMRFADEVLRIRKRVSGTITTLQDNGQTLNTSTDYLLKFVMDGSTLQTWLDGVQIGTDLTDTSITAGLQTGMHCIVPGGVSQLGKLEDFRAGDLVDSGAGATDLYRRFMGA